MIKKILTATAITFLLVASSPLAAQFMGCMTCVEDYDILEFIPDMECASVDNDHGYLNCDQAELAGSTVCIAWGEPCFGIIVTG